MGPNLDVPLMGQKDRRAAPKVLMCVLHVLNQAFPEVGLAAPVVPDPLPLDGYRVSSSAFIRPIPESFWGAHMA